MADQSWMQSLGKHVSDEPRSFAILRAGGLEAIARAASGTYALAAPNSIGKGARFSAASVGRFDEFGVDFPGKYGLERAQHHREGLLRLGMVLRSPGRTDIAAYRWRFKARSDGSIDTDFVLEGRRVIEQLLQS